MHLFFTSPFLISFNYFVYLSFFSLTDFFLFLQICSVSEFFFTTAAIFIFAPFLCFYLSIFIFTHRFLLYPFNLFSFIFYLSNFISLADFLFTCPNFISLAEFVFLSNFQFCLSPIFFLSNLFSHKFYFPLYFLPFHSPLLKSLKVHAVLKGPFFSSYFLFCFSLLFFFFFLVSLYVSVKDCPEGTFVMS